MSVAAREALVDLLKLNSVQEFDAGVAKLAAPARNDERLTKRRGELAEEEAPRARPTQRVSVFPRALRFCREFYAECAVRIEVIKVYISWQPSTPSV
jgi:hypothetical protein